jgi:TRAP-type C4-dicarboxylate transport system substrate-binding protein
VEGAAVTRRRVQQLEADGIEELRKSGMQIKALSADEKSGFQKAMAPAYKEFGARFGQANIDAISNAK